jgi:hypothetical protein
LLDLRTVGERASSRSSSQEVDCDYGNYLKGEGSHGKRDADGGRGAEGEHAGFDVVGKRTRKREEMRRMLLGEEAGDPLGKLRWKREGDVYNAGRRQGDGEKKPGTNGLQGGDGTLGLDGKGRDVDWLFGRGRNAGTVWKGDGRALWAEAEAERWK